MKKHLIPLSAVALLAMIGVAACGGNSSSASSATSSATTSQASYAVSITNKEALEATFYTGTANRSIEISLTPTVNILDALADGTLKIVSSNAEIVSVNGRVLTPVAAGEATITVTYHDVSDTVKMTVAVGTAKEIYGTVHAGTAEDPLDNEDAIKVGKAVKTAGESSTAAEYYIKGVVETWYHAPGERSDKVTSWFMKAAAADGDRFELYKCLKEDGSALSYDDIWKGATVVAKGKIGYYNDQMETISATFVSSEGTKPGAAKEITATVAEAVAAATAFEDGDSSYDYYVITGYVVKKSGDNYFLSDTAEIAEDTKDKALFELNYITGDNAKDLLDGAKLTVKTRIKNYHGQAENCGAITVTVLEPGKPWEITYTKKTVAEALAIAAKLKDGETDAGNYEIAGVITEITEEYSSYGNMSFKIKDADGTETILVYRMTISAAKAKGAVVGSTVTLHCQIKSFKETLELVNNTLISLKDASGAEFVSYGTLEAPISVADALGNNGTLCEATNGKFSSKKVFLQGVIVSAEYNSKFKTWTLVLADKIGATDTIKATGLLLDEEVAATIAPNDTIIVEHYIEYYNGYCLYYIKDADENYDYGNVVKRVKLGKSKLAASASNEHSTVSGLEDKYENDSEATFTVAADEGWTVYQVSVYGEVIEAEEDGSYKVVVAGDGEIVVVVRDASLTYKEETITVAHDSFEWDSSADTGTLAGTDFTLSYDGNGGKTKQSSYNSTDQLRIYKNAIFTITGGSGVGYIDNIVFTTAGGKNFAVDQEFTGGEFKGYTAEGTSATVVGDGESTAISFEAAQQVRMSKMVITFVAAA